MRRAHPLYCNYRESIFCPPSTGTADLCPRPPVDSPFRAISHMSRQTPPPPLPTNPPYGTPWAPGGPARAVSPTGAVVMGIVAVVLGALGWLAVDAPLCGLTAMPMAGVGFVLAAIALLAGGLRYGGAARWTSAAGVVVCVIALGVAWSSHRARVAADEAEEAARQAAAQREAADRAAADARELADRAHLPPHEVLVNRHTGGFKDSGVQTVVVAATGDLTEKKVGQIASYFESRYARLPLSLTVHARIPATAAAEEQRFTVATRSGYGPTQYDSAQLAAYRKAAGLDAAAPTPSAPAAPGR